MNFTRKQLELIITALVYYRRMFYAARKDAARYGFLFGERAARHYEAFSDVIQCFEAELERVKAQHTERQVR